MEISPENLYVDIGAPELDGQLRQFFEKSQPVAQVKIVTLDVLFTITIVTVMQPQKRTQITWVGVQSQVTNNIKMASSVWIDRTNTRTCELLIEFFTSKLEIHEILKLKKRTQKSK